MITDLKPPSALRTVSVEHLGANPRPLAIARPELAAGLALTRSRWFNDSGRDLKSTLGEELGETARRVDAHVPLRIDENAVGLHLLLADLVEFPLSTGLVAPSTKQE